MTMIFDTLIVELLHQGHTMTINRLISKVHYAAIICALLTGAAQANTLLPQEQELVHVIEKFLNPDQEPKKRMIDWANLIVAVVNKQPEAVKYQDPCNKFLSMVTKGERNVTKFAMEFKQFQDRVPQAVRTKLEELARQKNLNLKALVAIFTKRLAVQ